MDKLRVYVWIALAALFYVGYVMWQQDYPPAPVPAQVVPTPISNTSSIPSLPGAENVTPPTTKPTEGTTTTITNRTTPAERVTVRTDVFDLTVSLQGGDLERADLLKYPMGKDQPGKFIRLFDTAPETYFVAHTGLRAADEAAAPSHQAIYTSAAHDYQLSDGQDTLVVPLTWTDGQGIIVTKTYTFTRGHYAIGVEYKVTNQSTSNWQAASYVQLARHQPVVKASMFQAQSYAFMGPTIYDGKASRNLKLDKEENKNYHGTYTGGWFAAMQHHFVAAAVPSADQVYDYQLAIESPQQFLATYRGPLITVAAGGNGSFHETLFVGPKLTKQLEEVGSKLQLTVDYGWLTIIAGPLFWLLATVHGFIGNWGWTIIAVTLLIKAAFYKLTEASGKSMAKMREMGPRLKALQERYKDDREQLGRATMEFYKREKINPLAGCLPMLIQMPVFMAFYWAILNSAEMRQAPFIGYLTDLSSRDPYFILPALLGVANFMQFKLNPAPADPVQAKMMMMMPILMTGMMVMFPSGLVLYWITNTGLSILQQWHINRVVSGTAKKA
jgi:YidC/Oxa1 family membrane protein insertase